MDTYLEQRIKERKREYHRKWRAAHPESVRAAQERYWAKKALESRNMDPAADTAPTATVAGERTI